MSIGVHDFEIPHAFVRPARDMIIIRLPIPPKKIGSLHIPDFTRDMAQHSVMAGRIITMGPMAFKYKDGSGADGNGLAQQDVKVGDWVVVRPFAGTMMTGGKIQATGSWRYISSFQDVLGIIPSDKMPDPAMLLWDADPSMQEVEGEPERVPGVSSAPSFVDAFSFDNKKAV